MDAVTTRDTEHEKAILVSSISMKLFRNGVCLGLGITKDQIPDGGKVILMIKYDSQNDQVVIESIM